MNRCQMVSFGAIETEFCRLQGKDPMNSEPVLTDVFENGMIEVLRELATHKFLTRNTSRDMLPHIEEANKILCDNFSALRDKLPKKEKEALGDLEGDFNIVAGYEEEEAFVKGFIEGYRFLKTLHVSTGKD
ncbi:DUF6809 family protein [Paenibacillus sp. FSL M8-0228]|uniref:DUF6809 family protein n=1 Tax=Paenibacillus sp. FSL M8-0228 TaxID=2921620 RepID=UPI0030FB9BC2